jgi:hypothetical protein
MLGSFVPSTGDDNKGWSDTPLAETQHKANGAKPGKVLGCGEAAGNHSPKYPDLNELCLMCSGEGMC